MALDNELAVDIIQSVGRYWSDNEHSDCRISVDGQVFQASRFHLSACSEFFRQVFHTESITHKENIVIKGISADVFSCVIKALFTGVVGLDESNMVDVWLAASYLKIDFLVKKSEKFIEEHLTAQNYVQLYERISSLDSAEINKKLVDLMAQDFEAFRQTETFLNLPSEMVIKIVEIGEIKSQDNLVESVLKWASHVPKDVVGTFGLQLYHDFQDLMEKNRDDSCVTFGFSKEHVCQFVADDVTRSQILGQLIKKVNLGELSETGLKMIYEDKLAIEHHDVKDVVMHEFAARMLYRTDNKTVAVYQNTQPDSSSSDSQLTNVECEDKQLAKTVEKPVDIDLREFSLGHIKSYHIFEVPDWVVASYDRIKNYAQPQTAVDLSEKCYLEESVVFFTNQTFVMFYFEKHKFYKLFETESKIKQFYVFENNLYYSQDVDKDWTITMKITGPNQSTLIYQGSIKNSTSFNIRYFIAFPFIYKIELNKAKVIVSRTVIRESSNDVWTTILSDEISNSDDPHFSFYYTLVKGNNIILFLSGDESKIVYFDVNSHQLHHIHSVECEMANYKIFEMHGFYFMLLGNGLLFQIVHKENISIIFRQIMWKGTLNLHGVFHQRMGCSYSLYVFTDKRANVETIGRNTYNIGLHQVHLDSFIFNRQCECMGVHHSWLIKELVR
ncbi:uncharacterized protein LOC131956250 [Physella acuta]|uniref:uncharacterized protein LOC131956250 n=1 Tax=Physella acuta TaxID=109671 RepID=UPI0027DC876C|nr:uncharacterized protein LOC131956250 [Physella acuta]XP_059176659.1 uncharacterized protein LOC131956250 [Physella acuta]